ncbi:hypothetical protein CF327_g6785 [Tilletia walkeri]|nr:hypothetical protein CF327_g6785 [Tilletia walkeri]
MTSCGNSTGSMGSIIKRRRGRPKGSRNKAKHALSSPRRNPRRQSTQTPLHDHHGTSSPVHDEEYNCTLANGIRHDGIRPDDALNVFHLLEDIKIIFAPHLREWSSPERLRVALALHDFAHLCADTR